VTIKARLDGHEFDLQDLADWLPSGNIRVTKDDVGYYLSAAVIDNPPEGKTFYEAAQDLLPIVNGIGSLKSVKFSTGKARRPVSGRHSHMAGAGRASQGCERLKINRVVHIMATVQLRNPTEGRAHYYRRKSEGKTLMEALRALKRRLSNTWLWDPLFLLWGTALAVGLAGSRRPKPLRELADRATPLDPTI
jgi:hypothetical protein